MSDIKVGDLVYVAHGTRCCGMLTGSEGIMNTVAAMEYSTGTCDFCNAPVDPLDAKLGDMWFCADRLKRIPPLSELDHSTTEAIEPADCLAWHREKAHG